MDFACTLSHVQYGIFLPLFVFPYFLRCFRLLRIFNAHNEHFLKKKKKGAYAFKRVKNLRCVRESNLIKLLLISLIPFVILTLLAILDKDFRKVFPSFEVSPCLVADMNSNLMNTHNFQIHIYMSIETFLILSFI